MLQNEPFNLHVTSCIEFRISVPAQFSLYPYIYDSFVTSLNGMVSQTFLSEFFWLICLQLSTMYTCVVFKMVVFKVHGM